MNCGVRVRSGGHVVQVNKVKWSEVPAFLHPTVQSGFNKVDSPATVPATYTRTL